MKKDNAIGNNDAGNDLIYTKQTKNKKTTSKSFEYKTKIIGSTPANNNILDTEIVFP